MSTTSDAREEMPRISVDKLQDWERIKRSYTSAAYATLEARIASRSEADKRMLRGQLQRFIDRTFDKATMNLRINGRNFQDLNPEEQTGTDPFDEGLDRHIWSLSDQCLQWNGEIAKKRREKPSEARRLMKELIETQHEVDEQEAAEYDAIAMDVGELPPDLPDQTYENIEAVARETFAIAEELKQSASVQFERTGRLKEVTAEIKNLKP
ncbi:hypothetical protein EIP86_001073 [Pleurotus ostreatoroseus]|nr:hypothetical protein EIP86_001073 [Pleurotus ostreatoroseus]